MRFLATVVVSILTLLSPLSSYADNKVLSEKLSQTIPGLKVKAVEKTGIEGVFQVETAAGEILFSNADGSFFIAGDMYSTKGNTLVNLSEKQRGLTRISKVDSIAADQKIVFPAKGETKGRISVFTDIDCGYCRKLHKEVPELNEMGVEVSYLAYPRAGLNSESYKKYVSAYCSEDKLAAMTKAKRGQALEPKDCSNPVASQFNLGREIGISGTPAIILQDGTLIPGYINAQKIGKALGIL